MLYYGLKMPYSITLSDHVFFCSVLLFSESFVILPVERVDSSVSAFAESDMLLLFISLPNASGSISTIS